MLLERYKEDKLLFNSNFLEKAQEDVQAYRGELIIVEGEVSDDKGHTKPPTDVLRGAVILAGTSVDMLIGAIDDLASLPLLIDKYQSDFSNSMKSIIYVVNLEKPVQTTYKEHPLILIPLVQGVPWNETMEELAMEKSDFKGQSPGEKLVTMYEELKSYKCKYGLVDYDTALGMATEAKREGWGAV